MNISQHQEIFNKLDELICGYNFISIISELSLEDFTILDKEFKGNDCYEKLSEIEFLTIVGLWLKNINNKDTINSQSDADNILPELRRLMHELHLSFLPTESERAEMLNKNTNPPVSSLFQEAVYYGGCGTYDLQQIQFVEQKYINDRDWILKNKDVDIKEFKQFYFDLKRIAFKKLNVLFRDIKRTNGHTTMSVNSPYIFDIAHFRNINPNYIKIIDALSFDMSNPIAVNITKIGDYNPIIEFPIIKLNTNKIYLPYTSLVASSLYETPFFWMVKDGKYYNKEGQENRGKAAESITETLLCRLFSPENVHVNAIVKNKHEVKAEIDVLVLHNNTAIIFQIKAKRLSLKAKQGDIHSINEDYAKAIGKAYEQAYKSEISFLNNQNTCYSVNGDVIDATPITNCIKIGITLDFFPASESIARDRLDKKANFISVSIFDLDMYTKYIGSADAFIDYLLFRVSYRNSIIANNEASFFGYYLEHKGFEDCKRKLEEYNTIYIDNDYAGVIDSRMYKDLSFQFLGDLTEECSIKKMDINHRIERNEKCPCGSGFKFKKCCGNHL